MVSKFKLAVYRWVIVPFKILKGNIRYSVLFFSTMRSKRCHFGPFSGEFGHLLGHNLPFIAYLYSIGVKVDFCGLEIYKPFFIDEKGNQIVSEYLPLRDFFKEAAPDCNRADEPKDVEVITQKFIEKARASEFPYWDNSNHFYYFNAFRWWVLRRGYNKVFDLSKVYKTKDENAVVIFPRKMNHNFPGQMQAQLRNNGQEWDYNEVARLAAKSFDKVYVIGHPIFSADMRSFENVEVYLTNDNRVILEKCCNSKLIITQHSGSVYLGEYTNTQVLIIYKGGKTIGDIETTKKFKKGLGQKFEFDYAYNLEEIDNYLKKISN